MNEKEIQEMSVESRKRNRSFDQNDVPSLIEIYKEGFFSAGHHLTHVPDNHPCHNFHGHNYKYQITLQARLSEITDWVVDFSVISNFFKEEFDHKNLNNVLINPEISPTVENICSYAFSCITQLLQNLVNYEVIIKELVIWETETSCGRIRGRNLR